MTQEEVYRQSAARRSRARELYLRGYSISDIAFMLRISSTTASMYCKDLPAHEKDPNRSRVIPPELLQEWDEVRLWLLKLCGK